MDRLGPILCPAPKKFTKEQARQMKPGLSDPIALIDLPHGKRLRVEVIGRELDRVGVFEVEQTLVSGGRKLCPTGRSLELDTVSARALARALNKASTFSAFGGQEEVPRAPRGASLRDRNQRLRDKK